MGAVGGLMKAAGAAAAARSPLMQTLGALGGGSTPNPFSGLINPTDTSGSVPGINTAVPSPMDMAAGAMGQRGDMLQGAGAPPGRPQVAQLPAQQAYRQGIAGIESGGRYDAVGPTHPKLGRALGKYQIMEANIGPWSQEVLGRRVTPQEFMANTDIQDAIFDRKFGQYVQKFGPERAARAWLGGPGAVNDPTRKDVLGTSTGTYGQRFMASLGGTQPGEVATNGPLGPTVETQDELKQRLLYPEGVSGGYASAGFGDGQKPKSGFERVLDQMRGGKGGTGPAIASQSTDSQGQPTAIDTGEEEIAKLVEQQSQARMQPLQRAGQRKANIKARIGHSI